MRRWIVAGGLLALGMAGCTPAEVGGGEAGADVVDAAQPVDAVDATQPVDVVDASPGLDAVDATPVSDAPDVAAPDVVDAMDAVDAVDAVDAPADDGLCPDGTSACGTTCVDTQTDPAHCGAACTPCTTTDPNAHPTCTAGACGFACDPGFTPCGGACVDTSTDQVHCGACNNPCTSTEVCAAGQCAGAALYAVEPAVANVGQTVWLEGVFPPNTFVQFPGSGSLGTPTAAGRGRLAVTVPSDATAGEINVSVAGLTTASHVLFRTASFALGLQAFRHEYEQTGYARQMPRLLTARRDAASFQSGSWVYVLGGADASTALGSIERAMVNADGSLGAFRAAGSLMVQRDAPAAVRVGDALYVMGGGNTATIERAAIDPATGALGTFALTAGTLGAARRGHSAVVVGPWVYVLGGDSTTVERAAVQADGSLGAFAAVPGVSTRSARVGAAVVVAGSSLYVIGGNNGTRSLATIERASIDAAGNLSAFAQLSATLTVPREGARAVQIGSSLYVVGGYDSTRSMDVAAVESAPLDADGTPTGAFTQGSALNTARRGATVAVVGNYLYVIGGGSPPVAGVERAQINASGRIGVGTIVTPAMPAAISIFSLVAVGPYLYQVSGRYGIVNDGNAVPNNRAVLAPDGSIVRWEPVNQVYPQSSAFVAGDALELLGSRDANYCVSNRPDCYSLQPDGSLSWQTGCTNPSIADARASATPVIAGDYAYALGGYRGTCSSLGIRGEAWRAGVGSWAFSNVGDVGGLRVYAGALLDNDTFYLLGGNDSNGVSAASVGTGLASGSPTFTVVPGVLDQARDRFAMEVVGNRVYVMGGDTNAGATNSCVSASLPLGSTPTGAFGNTTNCLPAVRDGAASVTVGNSIYVVGGFGPGGADTNTVIRIPLM